VGDPSWRVGERSEPTSFLIPPPSELLTGRAGGWASAASPPHPVASQLPVHPTRPRGAQEILGVGVVALPFLIPPLSQTHHPTNTSHTTPPHRKRRNTGVFAP